MSSNLGDWGYDELSSVAKGCSGMKFCFLQEQPSRSTFGKYPSVENVPKTTLSPDLPSVIDNAICADGIEASTTLVTAFRCQFGSNPYTSISPKIVPLPVLVSLPRVPI